MTVKLLTEHHLEFLSLKGGCSGSSESTHVKVPHCWKLHALAQSASFFTDFQNQINDITSYIDASNVYGSSDEESAELRSFTGGNYKENLT